MSENRVPDAVVLVKLPRLNGKIERDIASIKSAKYEIFGAYQFEFNHRRSDRNFTPTVPIRRDEKHEWYQSMFRVRIGGKWYSPGGNRYEFFTKNQVRGMLL